MPSRVFLVTGASSGIGEATVRRLVAAGHRVAFTGRRRERLLALAAEFPTAAERLLALEGDVTSEVDRARWIAETLGRFGRLDGLVNNAGYGQRGALEELPIDAVRRNFETNVFSLLALTQAALPHLRAAGPGARVVNVSSVAGKISRPLSATYDATKHALEAFTDGLRQELRGSNIAVVSVQPGFILSEFAETARRESDAEIRALEAGRYGPLWRAVVAAEERARRLAGTPDQVARVIERALLAPSPAWRYAVPGHAKLFLLLRRLLPERVFALGLPSVKRM